MRVTSVRAGRALETLGHAVEYLTDESVERINRGANLQDEAGVLDAIDLLKSVNRAVYQECPLRMAWWARRTRWFGNRA